MAPRLLAPLRVSGPLALAALLVGAQELLGLLLPLVDLAVELPAGLVPGDLPGLLDALVRHVGMLPGQLLGLILHLAEIRHRSSSFSIETSGTLVTHSGPPSERSVEGAALVRSPRIRP